MRSVRPAPASPKRECVDAEERDDKQDAGEDKPSEIQRRREDHEKRKPCRHAPKVLRHSIHMCSCSLICSCVRPKRRLRPAYSRNALWSSSGVKSGQRTSVKYSSLYALWNSR